jgi:ribosome biogenesis GTPase
LSASCRFRNCTHQMEPGCAVRAALASGDLDAARLNRWQKLLREDLHNSETLAEARARSRAFGKIGKSAMAAKRKKRGD